MFFTKDHKTIPLFDPWACLGPKRRRLMEESWAGLFRKEIFDELPISKLRPFFSSGTGRPSKELYTAAGAIVLQQMHDLSDEETVYQVAFNQQWQYALDIRQTSDEATYICEKTLWNMRSIMMEHGLDESVFQGVVEKLGRVFGVDFSRQRLDSVHIQSNMKRLGRIGIVARSIRGFLVNLKRQHLELVKQVSREIIEKYVAEKAMGCFSLVKPSESQKTLEGVCRDLFALVSQFTAEPVVTTMHSYKLLERVLREQCTVVEAQGDDSCDQVAVRANKEICSDSLQNPSDPDASYDGHKGQGYQAQIMETYTQEEDPEKKAATLNLITHVVLEPAHKSDAHAVMPALESTQARGIAPKEVVCDSLYGSDENIEKAQEQGVEILSPVMGSGSQDTESLGMFQYGDTGEVTVCPRGNKPLQVKERKHRHTAVFSCEQCGSCLVFEQCAVKKGKRFYYLRYDDKARRCAQRRATQETAEFKDRYRWRAGVEATMSVLDRRTGLKHLRIRGLKAVRFCAVLKAAAINIIRATAVRRALRATSGPLQNVLAHLRDRYVVVKERCLSLFNGFTCFCIAGIVPGFFRPKIAF